MDIAYILGSGSRWNNNELRHSLRSAEMFGQNVGNVYIIGLLPDWITNVIHIPASDPFPQKHANGWHKWAIACKEIGKPFVLMNDDFFLLSETDFNKPMLFYDKGIKDLIAKYKKGRGAYVSCQIETYRYLTAHGYPTKNYATHVPITIDPEAFIETVCDVNRTLGYDFRNYYGNICAPQIATELPDLKFERALMPSAVGEILRGKQFFSISDKFLNTYTKQFIRELYPNKSKYEK